MAATEEKLVSVMSHELIFEAFESFPVVRDLLQEVLVNHKEALLKISAVSVDVSSPVSSTAGVVPSQLPGEGACDSTNQKTVKRVRTMPSVSIYRPPAARKLEQNASLSGMQPREVVGTSSPGKNKFRASDEGKEISPAVKQNANDGISVFRNAITSIRIQNKVPKCKNVESANKKTEAESKVVSKPEEVVKSTNQNKQRRPDIQVYVPKGRRSAGVSNDTKKSSSPVREEKSQKDAEVAVPEGNVSRLECVETKKVNEDAKDKQPSVNHSEGREVSENAKSKVTTEVTGSGSSSQTEPKVTSCSDKTDASAITNGHGVSEKDSESKSSKKVGHLNPDEDDWESMYDDSGECLDPSLLNELTSAVGDVTLEKPKSSYNGYKTKSLDTVADEFPHVIEIYNFPPEFQLQDLMTVFSQFKNSGFEIKWVDETHALGIFSSSAIVSEVLDFYHPFVKTRSLKDGTLLSKMKARRSAEFLLPYKPRPETCSALARRLVTGALGVRLPTSRQEREAEKQILTKARERKRLEAKQKEDAWEGTFS